MDSPIGIAGAGRIAQALGRLLRDRGEPVAAIAGRDAHHTDAAAAFVGVRAVSYAELPDYCKRVVIAVPDDGLDAVVSMLAGSMRGGEALHTSGMRGPEALRPLEALGVSCAALHPLQTVTTAEQGLTALPGSTFAITGSGFAATWALHIVELLGGEALQISPANRPLYHAAAVMASNYLTVLMDAAVILMREAGVEPAQVLRALAPLSRASIENALTMGPVAGLTGPVERGDNGTVAAHLSALAQAPESVPESVKALYRAAGLHAIDMARRKTPGIDRGRMELLLRKAHHQ